MNVWDGECPALTLLIYYEIELSPNQQGGIGTNVQYLSLSYIINQVLSRLMGIH